MGSSFIHLIRTDSNEFFLMALLSTFIHVYAVECYHAFVTHSSISYWNNRYLLFMYHEQATVPGPVEVTRKWLILMLVTVLSIWMYQ